MSLLFFDIMYDPLPRLVPTNPDVLFLAVSVKVRLPDWLHGSKGYAFCLQHHKRLFSPWHLIELSDLFGTMTA